MCQLGTVAWKTKRHVLNALAGTLLFLLAIAVTPQGASASYFGQDAFGRYSPQGPYPFWSSSWVHLDPKVRVDSNGIPFVIYSFGSSYNPVTVGVFGLLAYNRWSQHNEPKDRTDVLALADWLVQHQDSQTGSWYYDFDYTYPILAETLQKPWNSAMAQGLAISLLTRAYSLRPSDAYLRAAEQALLPLSKDVSDGGLARPFALATSTSGRTLTFLEEYPTRSPSFALNGFMFTLLGLYDLSATGNKQAAGLFHEGLRTLRRALPLYDLGDGSAYDLGHLTSPPRPVHSDSAYHLVHIALLNALGSVTQDPVLLWYRDQWNSYGTRVTPSAIWLSRLGIWIARRHPVTAGMGVLLVIGALVLVTRIALGWMSPRVPQVRSREPQLTRVGI
jgi:hypothetical protein